jgi:hypothetical protein
MRPSHNKDGVLWYNVKLVPHAYDWMAATFEENVDYIVYELPSDVVRSVSDRSYAVEISESVLAMLELKFKNTA